ncbi:MAG: YicC family protein [Oscillospiraceae bacterium]|nr:YicC family protein [Oscillospiraceae bacterium]
MIKSMTGYGSAQNGAVKIELKSVNNRYFDFNVKLPRAFMSLEEPLKQQAQKRVSRGKLDVFVTLDLTKTDTDKVAINLNLAEAYYDAATQIADKLRLSRELSPIEIMKLPDVVRIERDDGGAEELAAAITSVFEDALTAFDAQREREGANLGADIASRLDELERLTARAAERSTVTVAEYRAKLAARMAEILENTQLDESRILTEAAIFADKVAINEETVRLGSHIAELRGMLKSAEPVGRKLDFLVQELNREANTIGSKGNDAEMSRIVVDLKAEIEKIREQAQNIE